MSCKEEDFITPNDYCDFFDILEAPSDFNYLLMLSVDIINGNLLNNNININSKTRIEWEFIKKAILEQIKFINNNSALFGIDNNKITNSNHDNIKIGHVTLSKSSNSNGNQKDIFMNKKTLQLSPITYQNLLYIGYLYRGLYC